MKTPSTTAEKLDYLSTRLVATGNLVIAAKNIMDNHSFRVKDDLKSVSQTLAEIAITINEFFEIHERLKKKPDYIVDMKLFRKTLKYSAEMDKKLLSIIHGKGEN